MNYGDLEVLPSGNLLVVSSDENSIAEFTSFGSLLTSYPLPAGVSGLSGVAVHCGATDLWVCTSSGDVYQLNGGPCVNTLLQPDTLFSESREDESQKLHVTVYPNPTSGLLEIAGVSETDTYKIRSQTGALVEEGLAGNMQLDLSALPSGRYLIEISNGRTKIVEPVIVE